MMIRALPLCAARQASRRRLPLSAECMTTTPELKRRRNRSTSCGVSAISGTSTRTCPSPASAAAMTRRYTSVLPLPVTPYSRCAANLPSVAVIASTTCDCASVRVTSLGRGSNGAGCAGASSAATQPRSASLLKCPGLNGSTSSAAVAPSRSARNASSARCRGARFAAGSAKLPASRSGQRPTPMAFARRLAASQADRQRRRHDFPDGVVIILRRPAQQVEGDRVEDRLAYPIARARIAAWRR